MPARPYRQVAAKVLGRPLKPEEVVHHVDEDHTNNANNNLVICPDRAYHNFLHKRLRAFKAYGNPEARQCCYCTKWDLIGENGMQEKYYHLDCWSRDRRIRRFGFDPGKRGAFKPCEKCGKKAVARSLCVAHYKEARRRKVGVPPRGYRLPV